MKKEASMEPETSQFESSEMLATYLASTPLLDESWRLCSRANAAAPRSFLVHRVGQVGYLTFSGVQLVSCSEENCRKLVKIDDYANGIFGGFTARGDADQEPIMVHGGLLQLFLLFFHTQNFKNKFLRAARLASWCAICELRTGRLVADVRSASCEVGELKSWEVGELV